MGSLAGSLWNSILTLGGHQQIYVFEIPTAPTGTKKRKVSYGGGGFWEWTLLIDFKNHFPIIIKINL